MAGERLYPEPEAVFELAALIRKVDGNHDLGASALAEALIDAGWPSPEPLPLDVERLARAMSAWYGRQGDGDHPRTWIDEDAPAIAREYAREPDRPT